MMFAPSVWTVPALVICASPSGFLEYPSPSRLEQKHALCFSLLFKHFHHMSDGLLKMVTHSIGRPNRIACLAGGENLTVFRVETLCISRNIGCRIEMQVGVRGIPQFLNHGEQSRTSRKAIQSQMELLILLNIVCCIAGRMHLIEDSSEWRSILGLEALGGFLYG